MEGRGKRRPASNEVDAKKTPWPRPESPPRVGRKYFSPHLPMNPEWYLSILGAKVLARRYSICRSKSSSEFRGEFAMVGCYILGSRTAPWPLHWLAPMKSAGPTRICAGGSVPGRWVGSARQLPHGLPTVASRAGPWMRRSRQPGCSTARYHWWEGGGGVQGMHTCIPPSAPTSDLTWGEPWLTLRGG